MMLKDYLRREGVTQREFAKQAGLSTGTVSLLVQGKVWISEETARKIFKATKGRVTAHDFLKVAG